MHVRELMRRMRWPNPLGEELMTAYDHDRMDAFLKDAERARRERRNVRERTSWTNPETRVEYRVKLGSRGPTCASTSITADLTRVVDADLGDMTNEVSARFCRRGDGRWRYEHR